MLRVGLTDNFLLVVPGLESRNSGPLHERFVKLSEVQRHKGGGENAASGEDGRLSAATQNLAAIATSPHFT